MTLSNEKEDKIINSIKDQIIDKLKYIFKDIDKLKYIDDKNENDNNNKKENELNEIFKKIKILFIVLSDILKFLILQVDNKRYQNIINEKVKFPKNLDELIIIIGCYGDAFTEDIQEELFNILDSDLYNDLYTISEINSNMIPFVANDKIKLDLLKTDYLNFSKNVQNISCNVLHVNTDFDDVTFIEYI